MTRITDFGRKRTHVEAGFEEPIEPQASTSTLPSESQPHDNQVPPQKKRKRTKKPKESGGEGEVEGKGKVEAQDAGDPGTAKVEPKKKLKDKRKPKCRSFTASSSSMY